MSDDAYNLTLTEYVPSNSYLFGESFDTGASGAILVEADFPTNFFVGHQLTLPISWSPSAAFQGYLCLQLISN
jgi:hypothetical protein